MTLPRATLDDQLARLRQGDHAAFTRLVKHYHARLLVVARAIAGDAWGEEVMQEAWIAVYRALPGFEGRSSLQTWLFTIVKHAAQARLRKEKRVKSLDSSLEDNNSSDVERLLDQRFDGAGRWQDFPGAWRIDSAAALLEETELRRCIDKCLRKLPARQRAVLMMRDMEQMDMQSICDVLEISESNGRVLLHRARLSLMGTIGNYLESGEC
ncbi:MAG: sigma-70 family RNA polymerase sigma factor [Pseudohongiellaceae bacterium]